MSHYIILGCKLTDSLYFSGYMVHRLIEDFFLEKQPIQQ